MKSVIQTVWPLFLGITLLMIGNGLQGTLLGVRATIEGFSTATTGLIMSLYYAGYLGGSILVPRLVKNVGHIRVFAALASLASVTTLAHGTLIDPYIWGAARLLTGFSFAGLYIVIESWLNHISTNANRGKILGCYLLIFYGAMVTGQYLMNVADPENIELFIITSVLISLALLPISLSSSPAPKFEAPRPIGPKEVYKASPLGVTGIFFSGLANGIFFTLGPVFALQSGMNVSGIANFMAVFAMGGVCAQLPLGLLSDKVERRKIIMVISLLASICGVLCFLFADAGLALYGLVFLFGCNALSIYGICAAYTNDHLEREQFVGASAALILISGCGALTGPFTASLIMTALGIKAFFPLLACIYGSIYIFALHRARIRPPVPVEKQGSFISSSPGATPMLAEDDPRP